MMKQIFALLALLASASAFVPAGTSAAFGVSRAAPALSMAMKAPEFKNIVAAAAGVIPAVVTSSAALATEGTNEWFGVDDGRLLAVLFVVHWGILSLWFGAYGKYDEKEDFFGEIDYTGTGKK